MTDTKKRRAADDAPGPCKDSVTGQLLPEVLVRAARQLELEYFEKKQVWEKMPRSKALAKTGKAPISVRWTGTNKGDNDAPNIRCRLVATEIRKSGEDPICAPTPPLEKSSDDPVVGHDGLLRSGAREQGSRQP